MKRAFPFIAGFIIVTAVIAGAQDDPVRLALTTDLASEIERRHIAVRNAKRAVSIGPPLIQASYPILPLTRASPVPETALLLALTTCGV